MTILTGIILAGGESKRMGQPKGWLNYHGEPQVYWLHKLLLKYCETVVVSANEWPQSSFELHHIKDTEPYINCGPIGGILSIFKQVSGNFLVLGCDYPLLDNSVLETLINQRNPNKIATAFGYNNGLVEPLVTIYEQKGLNKLKTYFNSGRTSLSKFLSEENAHIIQGFDMNKLCSFDYSSQFKAFRNN